MTDAGMVRHAASRVSVSIVIPVHNEGAAALAVVEALTEEFRDCHSEIIVVDDASTDAGIPSGFGDNSGVRVLRLSQRAGSGMARRIGTSAAQGELIAWMDGDGTYLASDVRRLVDGMGDFDQLVGCRSSEQGTCRLMRQTVKSIINRLVSSLWSRIIPDLNSGLRVFRREAAREILEELPHGFSCTSTATLAMVNRGRRIGFLPIAYLPRGGGAHSKFHPVWDTWRLLRVIHRQWRARRHWEGVARLSR